MLKKILAPIQSWILEQGKCVGCGRNLKSARHFEIPNNAKKVICACARIFIFDKRKGTYRRALLEESKTV